MKDLRGDFPLLQKEAGLAYLDSACTSLKPKSVIDAELSYYTELGACGGRSSHRLGRRTSERVEQSREEVAGFVGARGPELIWTKNTTEGLNIVANALDYSKRRKVVTSVMEHHSALLPLMRMRDEGRIDLEILGCDSKGAVAMEAWEEALEGAALVMTHSYDNTTGGGNDIRALARAAHDAGALICVDGAQGVPHHKTDMRELDFLCFYAHKMLGPTGIGALVVRKGLLREMRSMVSGGGTVRTVSLAKVEQMEDQTRFEAGVQHYSGMIGFGAACAYLRAVGMENVESHEREIGRRIGKALGEAGASVYGPEERQGALYSFNIGDARPHDVALLLDKENVAVRSGFFCAQPALEAIGAKGGAVRASAYIYNTPSDAERLGAALAKISQLY